MADGERRRGLAASPRRSRQSQRFFGPMWYRTLLLALLAGLGPASQPRPRAPIVTYVVQPAQLRMYYRDEQGRRYGSIGRLRAWLSQHQQRLVFAMNGGMYAPGGAPQGLFIERGRTVTPLDTSRGTGNFYLPPNGVFYLTPGNHAGICPTAQFAAVASPAWATQSGPLLLVGGTINARFTKGSRNVAVRNGVGILPGNRVIFAISREKINFYDFAAYFKALGCQQALYLDGYVSRLYLPQQGWQQTDGDFGVILGVAQPSCR